MYTLIIRCTFDAAHSLPGYGGKCEQVHGHTYRVEAEFSGEGLDQHGMLQDFITLRQAVEGVLPDHSNLNDVLEVASTAENLAAWIFHRLRGRELPVTAVTVWETDHYACRYVPSDSVERAEGG